ncbi:hypothetical protein A2U01_0013635, partial [Trifolium medium]|nr:hypothetical protein [Trifolium medium]
EGVRQREMVRILKDDDLELSYHPGRANVVGDTLGIMFLQMSTFMARELELIERFRNVRLVCDMTTSSVELSMMKLANQILEEIREAGRWI